MTVKQRHIDALLKSRDLPADRRLTEVQGLTGMSETARFGNGVKYSKLISIHFLFYPANTYAKSMGLDHRVMHFTQY